MVKFYSCDIGFDGSATSDFRIKESHRLFDKNTNGLLSSDNLFDVDQIFINPLKKSQLENL